MDLNDDDVPDTRVFVSGIPPKYTSDQLGAHFAGRYQITDALVIPGRQIGFVGFRNYTLAKNAVKYFDKTYIRMSKISVSLAKPVEMSRDGRPQAAPVSQRASRATQSDNPENIIQRSGQPLGGSVGDSTPRFTPYVALTSVATSNKRKRVEDVQQGSSKNEDLKEFLAVMQPSSKSTWTDDVPSTEISEVNAVEKRVLKKKPEKHETTEDFTTGNLVIEDRLGNKHKKKDKCSRPLGDPSQSGPHANVDKAVEEQRRRKKKDNVEIKQPAEEICGQEVSVLDQENTSKAKRKRRTKDRTNTEGGVEPLDDDAFGVEHKEADHAQLLETKSDLDWLRAKTSRLLDLVSPEETAKLPVLAKQDHSYSGNESSGVEEATRQVKSGGNIEGDDSGILPNGRLFVRNLPFNVADVDLQSVFSKYGKVAEVHVVKDYKTSAGKGLAYIQFVEPQAARAALTHLDGKSFQGRLLHVLPASDKKTEKLNDFELSKLPLKKQKALKRKAHATTSSFSWNSLYMNPDAVLSSAADRLGVDKGELIDVTSSDAAVKQALAETDIIQKTKSYLNDNGVNVDAFESRARDDRTLLLKNFAYGTTSDELKRLLEPFGDVSKFVFPPTGTMAIAQYREPHAAGQAVKQLAYRNFKGSVLFLEKGPEGLFGNSPTNAADNALDYQAKNRIDQSHAVESSTVFVSNLNFATTSIRLSEVFKPLAGFKAARVKTRTDSKRPGEILSMGFGFIDFATKEQANAAISAMSGYSLDGHDLLVKASQKTIDVAEERRKLDTAKKRGKQQTKVIIKNLPFEASKKDIQNLFSQYGQLRTVRVPKKFDNSTRGFAFAEFVTAREAESAMEALRNTHLLGRRLVLEFAEGESIDPEDEIQKLEKKAGQQTSMIQLSKLTGSARRKFNVDARDDEGV